MWWHLLGYDGAKVSGNVMTANEDLITRSTRWLHAGGVVSCKACQSQKTETDRIKAFVHLADFGHAGQHYAPWDDLDVICQSFKHKK